MHKYKFVLLFLVAISIRLSVASLIQQPGYMDAAYYSGQGIQIAEGVGSQDPYLWNYLSMPTSIPTPAFNYWMPMPALLAAIFWRVDQSFWFMQLPFVILSSLTVVLGAYIAWEATKNLRHFWTAGMLLTFSGSVTPFLTLPETFTPFAFFGTLCLWLSGRYWQSLKPYPIATAASAAVLAYLTRSDGLLLVMIVLALPLCRCDWKAVAIVGFTIGLLLLPWIRFNLLNHGYWLPTAGIQTLWLTTYDDFYCFNCDLSLYSYLDWGWTAILYSKLRALGWNLLILIFALGFVSLFPLTIIGGWQLRRSPIFVIAWFYLLLLFCAMTFAFTFPGPRGSLQHSSVTLLPFSVAATIVGLEQTVTWVGTKRSWNIAQAQVVFSTSIMALAVVLTLYAVHNNVVAWSRANIFHKEIGHWLDSRFDEQCPVLVGDPPSFWYTTRWPSLVVPNEDAETLLEVAQYYGACWMLLDHNRPQPLQSLYESDGGQGWELVYIYAPAKLFRRVATDTVTALR